MYMRRIQIHTLLYLACWTMTALAGAALAKEFRIGHIGDAFYANELGRELITEAYRRLGHSIRLEKLPPERALAMLNQGELDGDLVRSRSSLESSFPNVARIRFPVVEDEFAAFGIGHVLTPDGWASLKPYRLVSGRIRALLDRQGELNITFVSKAEQGFEMLRAGRADLVILTRGNICQAMRAGIPGLQIQEPGIETVRFYHYVNKRHAELALQIESTLQDMQRDGTLARMTLAAQQRWAKCDVPGFSRQ